MRLCVQYGLCWLLLLAGVSAFIPSHRLPALLRTANHPSLQNKQNLLKHYGIPKLFRWLVDLYPIVLESVGEGMTGSNAMAVDNFYLDMNGIIHTCTHSNDDKLIVFDEKAMFNVRRHLYRILCAVCNPRYIVEDI
jgi:hypothetical protein